MISKPGGEAVAFEGLIFVWFLPSILPCLLHLLKIVVTQTTIPLINPLPLRACVRAIKDGGLYLKEEGGGEGRQKKRKMSPEYE